MIELPKDFFQIHDELVAYRDVYKGKAYVNIRKTYIDKDTGRTAIGKGLTLSEAQWDALKQNWPAICDAMDAV
jgi:hypothetical protein